MKVFVLAKRQYMGKDLLDDRFGRFRELPLELARLGHTVAGLTLSYRSRRETNLVDYAATGDGQVSWQSVNLMHRAIPDLPRYFRRARQVIGEFQPDVIWAGSDAFHAIFGQRLAHRFHKKCVIDWYDNFESFTATKVPGVLPLFRRAVKKADGGTFFSQRMADYVTKSYPLGTPYAVILSAVRKEYFHHLDRNACRRELHLPDNAQIIGTAGALDFSRGIDALFAAFAILSRANPNLHLAFAGTRSAKQKIPPGPRIHDFRLLPQERVPVLLNALDLAVVCYRQSAQGEYSFPQKAYEIVACGTPMIAAAVGSMNELLRDHPECLYRPEDPTSLADAIRRQLERPTTIKVTAPSWADSAAQLDNLFREIIDVDQSARHQPHGVTAYD